MRSSTLALALITLATVGCQARPEPTPPPPAAPTLKVHDGTGDTGPLPLDRVDSLSIDGTFPATPGPHAVRVDVVNPQGMVYGSVRDTVVAGPGGSAGASLKLQVRGTTIDTYRRIGSWEFLLVVDDGAPLATTSLSIVE